MWKAVLAGTAALAIAGTSVVYAQQREGRWMNGGRHGQTTIEDMRAYADARLAALKAGLQLTPDQEKNWPAFEQAARGLAKLRFDRMAARRDRVSARREARRNEQQQQSTNDPAATANQSATNDPIDRLRQRGIVMAQTGTALKNLADATDPLYKSLDDGQKRRFSVLSHVPGLSDQRSGFRGREGRGEERGWRRGERRGEFAPERAERGQQSRDRESWRRDRDDQRGRWNNDGQRDRRGNRSGSDDNDNGRENL